MENLMGRPMDDLAKINVVVNNRFCEKCWAHAFALTYGMSEKTQSEKYYELIKECSHGKGGGMV